MTARSEGTIDRKAIASHIEAARKARGWSRSRLARVAEISERTLVRIEYAEGVRDVEVFAKVAAALGVSLSRLFAGESDGVAPGAIEQFICSNPRVTDDEAAAMRRTRWYHPDMPFTVGMAERQWLDMRTGAGHTVEVAVLAGRKKLDG